MMRLFINAGLRFAVFGVALMTSGVMFGCGMADGLFAGGSSSTETGDQVALTGRVTGGTGDGIAGVIVTLQGTPLADTTDITGAYSVSGRVTRPGASHADTLHFALNGQTVAKRAVAALTTSVPEIQIVQRGFSGTISSGGASITRIEGVVKGDDIAPGDSIAATFFYNTLSNNYSGFIWFPPPSSTVRNYTVHVNVYGANDSLIGRSPTVPFNSLAGNITIPDFDSETVNDL
jgi:hypothetical protein